MALVSSLGLAPALMLAMATTSPGEANPPINTVVPAPAAPAVSPSQITQEPLVCPPGQFASPFSDVYPSDWAYQAVAQLAGVPMQCFDLPSSSHAGQQAEP